MVSETLGLVSLFRRLEKNAGFHTFFRVIQCDGATQPPLFPMDKINEGVGSLRLTMSQELYCHV
jgi:hypothetical protein